MLSSCTTPTGSSVRPPWHGYEPRVAILDGRAPRTLPRGRSSSGPLRPEPTHRALSVRGASMLCFSRSLAVAPQNELHETPPRVLEDRADDDLQRLLEPARWPTWPVAARARPRATAIPRRHRLTRRMAADRVLLLGVGPSTSVRSARALAAASGSALYYASVRALPAARRPHARTCRRVRVAPRRPLHHTNNPAQRPGGRSRGDPVIAGAQVRGRPWSNGARAPAVETHPASDRRERRPHVRRY